MKALVWSVQGHGSGIHIIAAWGLPGFLMCIALRVFGFRLSALRLLRTATGGNVSHDLFTF